MTRAAAQRGFTLVEVMISLVIFGLLAAAGVALLSFSVRAQTATGVKLDEISALNRLNAILTADLAQAEIRPVRGQGGEALPAFTGESGTSIPPALRFVRSGWSNLDGAPRPSAQRVEYSLIDGAFARVAYPMLDGAQPLSPAALLTHVRRIALRYRYKGAWSDRWVGTPQAPLPDALELRVLRASGLETRQLFLVGTGYGKRDDATAG